MAQTRLRQTDANTLSEWCFGVQTSCQNSVLGFKPHSGYNLMAQTRLRQTAANAFASTQTCLRQHKCVRMAF